jgi:flagellar motor switch protein FliG
MGVYTRFKRTPEGFRALVELLETTPIERRKRMIEVGMAEDAAFTEKALSFVMTFEDITRFSDMELAELATAAPPRFLGFALHNIAPEIVDRFLRNAKPVVRADIKDYLESKIGPREIGGARLKVIESARQLEKKGYIFTKKIPV